MSLDNFDDCHNNILQNIEYCKPAYLDNYWFLLKPMADNLQYIFMPSVCKIEVYDFCSNLLLGEIYLAEQVNSKWKH